MPVVDDGTRRRWRRGFGRRRKNALQLGQQADQQIEKLLIRRFDRLLSVRRFIFLWVSLFLLLYLASFIQIRSLSSYYQTLKPVPGGLYSEGLIGTFSNANPIYASSASDTAVSHLVFSGLFRYSNDNVLVGDLAKDWQLNASQTRYTVHLRHGVTWHDGQPFTADDVIFTYHTIQNIEAQSPLYVGWQGVNVTKQDAYTVNFDLPNALGSFPYSLTNGILPAHLFKKTVAAQMRSASFNVSPVGTGPFEWKFVEVTDAGSAQRQQRISLAAFDHYYGGRPKLDGFTLTTFTDDQHLIAAFNKKQLNAMSGLDTLPDEFAKDDSVHAYTTPLTSAVMAFFNNSRANLSDALVRKALVSGANRAQLPGLLHYPVNLTDGPLLKGQLGYDPSITELPYNVDSANQLLDQAGWRRGADGIRVKDGKPLTLSLASQNVTDYTQVAQFLQKQWDQLGIKVAVHYYSSDDIQTAIITSHDFDILLYGINIGVDPDVFVYWDSSQANLTSQGHLNLSEYKSKAVDQALESARTRANPSLRIAKYQSFLSTWVQDAPALALYQPNYLYITRGPVFDYNRKAANSPADRFYNVNQWMIRQRHQNI